MPKAAFLRFLLLSSSIIFALAALADGASTRDFAVEASATVQESPPQIDFSWVGDASAEEYRVYRKSIGDTAWTGPVAVLDGSATYWTDTDVALGDAFEYSFRKVECVITDTVAVTSGTAVTFTIHDTWGDGICCNMGLGHYEVSGCGVAYASGGVFNNSESTPFTVGSTENPCDELAVHVTLDVFGAETRWELTEDATGDTLGAGGPYSSPRFGNILAGISYEAPEDWGAVLLLVDEPVADSLASELQRLEIDMIRDGYRVIRRDVPDGTSVPDVKDLVVAECQADPDITTLLILGNLAVPYSGNVKGGHLNHQGAWPADVYYGELDALWTDTTVNNTRASRTENHNVPGDGKFDQTYLPSDVDLQVGRVDLSNMPAFAESEVALLRRYLDKNHAFRSGDITVPRSGLIRDAVGVLGGTAYACTGWRNFTAMFGSSQLTTNVWFPALENSPRLCAYGCGGGSFTSCATVATTTDFATRTVYAVFTMMMGSYFGDWDSQNNLMRAALGAAGYPLTCCWAGKPAWLFHHMALGYPIGYSTRITQNNHLLHEIGYGGRQIHIALMGDPTLRLHPVKPPTALGLEGLPGQAIRLTWRAPEDSPAGYYVYRAGNLYGGFTRLCPDLIQDTTYVDSAPVPGLDLYMVRAVKLETTASGSYLNPSPGVIDSIEVSAGLDAPPRDNLLENSPNPFVGGTRISYRLAAAGPVLLRIYDVAGRLVREIDEGEREAGGHSFEWDGRDAEGHRVASGVYFLSLDTDAVTLSTKVIRLK
jgi:hypothetical protein